MFNNRLPVSDSKTVLLYHDQVTTLLDLAQRLGLIVGRTHAFADGPKAQHPVQVQLGSLNSEVLQ